MKGGEGERKGREREGSEGGRLLSKLTHLAVTFFLTALTL